MKRLSRFDVSKLKAIARFGEDYRRKYLGDCLRSRKKLEKDWFSAVKFFFSKAFYQGRRDELSQQFQERADQALAVVLGRKTQRARAKLEALRNAGWLSRNRWEAEANPLQVALCKEKVNKRYDRLLVISTLAFVSQLFPRTLTEHCIAAIKNGRLRDLHEELDKLKSVGAKIASLYLRDIVEVYGLEVENADQKYIQPIDTWVAQVAFRLRITRFPKPHTSTSESIVAACLRAGVSPVRFNEGAWYLATHAQDILLRRL